ncbi:MAG: sulfur carrier protein ThiS [Pirellulaceae bacterium]
MESTIAVEFNGKPLAVPRGTTLTQLLDMAEMRSRLVAIEVNLEIVPREQHAEYAIRDGDRIEAVTLVGGG